MIPKMQKYGFTYGHQISPELEQAFGGILAAQIDEDLGPLLDQTASQLASVQRDPRYTPEGKLYERRKIGAAAHAKLDELTPRRRRRFEDELAKLDLPSRVPTTAELAADRNQDPGLLYQMHRELREQVAKMDPVERRVALLDAAYGNDRDVLAATAAAHPLVRPVTPDLANEASEIWLNQQIPPSAELLRTAVNVYDSNAALARKKLAEDTTVRHDDPIVRQAMSNPNVPPPPKLSDGSSHKEASGDRRLPSPR